MQTPRTHPPNEDEAGRPGGNQPKTQNRPTANPPWYVELLASMTIAELAKHCENTLVAAIRQSQARQIAIIAKHGTHPHAYDETAHRTQQQRASVVHQMVQAMKAMHT